MNEKCVNCGISNVPLYLGLDGNLHCADHVGILLLPTPTTAKEEEHHACENHKS
ncbi:MAG: hypothetical protein PUE88_06610 [Ruminococcus sp.]|nr:hypothetical protein [Ruminococcus sp.]MDD6586377.1 hypothetical protein [Ruminococcus sp.]